jgi:hypothetical protein
MTERRDTINDWTDHLPSTIINDYLHTRRRKDLCVKYVLNLFEGVRNEPTASN